MTGKGGTGKSTVAAALALGLAAEGKTVLLCEVEGRQGIAQLFDVPPLPYEERQVAATDDGAVYALAIDAESALLEYLAMFYRLGRAGKALDRFGVIDFATTIAPGVRDVLLTGKVYEAVRRREDDDSYTYDAVVLDAPPTGRIAQFLNVSGELAGLARVGPIKNQSDTMMTLFKEKKVAFIINGPWEVNNIKSAPSFGGLENLGIAPVPAGSAKAGSPIGGHNYVVYSGMDEEKADENFTEHRRLTDAVRRRAGRLRGGFGRGRCAAAAEGSVAARGRRAAPFGVSRITAASAGPQGNSDGPAQGTAHHDKA